MAETTLLDKTRAMLAQALADGLRVKDLHRLSRGNLEYEWIRKFHRGEIPDPGVQRLQMLHDLLAHLANLPPWQPGIGGTLETPMVQPQ